MAVTSREVTAIGFSHTAPTPGLEDLQGKPGVGVVGGDDGHQVQTGTAQHVARTGVSGNPPEVLLRRQAAPAVQIADGGGDHARLPHRRQMSAAHVESTAISDDAAAKASFRWHVHSVILRNGQTEAC